MINGPDRRYIADTIHPVHGYGIDDDLLQMLLDDVVDMVRTKRDPREAIAAAMGRNYDAGLQLRREHFDDRHVS